MDNKYKVLIALDWADTKHDGCLSTKDSETLEKFKLKQSAKSIANWVKDLNKRFGKTQYAVILEQKKGALISALLKYDCFNIYPVNPATLATYRKAFAPSGAKDDPTDAALMLELLRLHPSRVSKLELEDEQTRTLSDLTP